MDRRSFLRSLGLTPLALGGLSLISPRTISAAKETSPILKGTLLWTMVIRNQNLRFQGPIDLRGVTKEARVERNSFHLVVYDPALHADWPTFPAANEERVLIYDSRITLAIPYGGYALLLGDGALCNYNHLYGLALFSHFPTYPEGSPWHP